MKLIFKSHIDIIKHFDEQRLNKMSLFQNYKPNKHEKIAQLCDNMSQFIDL